MTTRRRDDATRTQTPRARTASSSSSSSSSYASSSKRRGTPHRHRHRHHHHHRIVISLVSSSSYLCDIDIDIIIVVVVPRRSTSSGRRRGRRPSRSADGWIDGWARPKKNQCGRVIAKAIERKNGLIIRTEIDSTARHGSRETDGVDARRRSHGRYVLCMCHTHKTAQRTAIASSSITNGAR